MMTIRNAFDHYVKSLSSVYEKEEAESIARLMFEERVGNGSSNLSLHGGETLNEVKANDLAWKLLRLMKGEPAQYVLSYSYFYDLKLKVNKSALIPRPETEELVQWIIEQHHDKKNLKLLDIGTGSGCIAVALKKNLTPSNVFAMDISEAALRVADENAETNDCEVHFVHGDILQQGFKLPYAPFSLIVSNPPYILESEKSSLHKNVLNYEPAEALFVPDDDPLKYYKAIIQFSKENLETGGQLYFEINTSQKESIVLLAEAAGLKNVTARTDLSGNERMVKATK